MPVSDDVPLDCFTKELRNALNAIDNTLLLNKEFIIKNLGSSALERFIFYYYFYFSMNYKFSKILESTSIVCQLGWVNKKIIIELFYINVKNN